MTKSLRLSMLAVLSGSLVASAQSPLDEYITNSAGNNYTTIVDVSNQVSNAVDLDWHPTRQGELWILNMGTSNSGGTTVIVSDAGTDTQTAQYRKDGNSWHFLASGSSMAFSENGNWGTAQGRLDANHNGSTFTGPSLWSSDLNIYGILGNPPTSAMNGSHLDMLHQSPYGMGIAAEVANVFWVFDGYNGNICRYDFVDDHGPGQADHSDGRIKRYTEVQVARLSDIPSHMVLDDDKKWLYINDIGNSRVLRMDITTGSVSNALPSANGEPISEHSNMTGVTWEVYLTDVDRPCGIDISGDRLVISDYATGLIRIYDISDDENPSLVGTIDPGSSYVNQITGVSIDESGRIWFTDRALRHVIRIDNSNITPVGTEELVAGNESMKLFPNPTSNEVTVELDKMTANANYMVRLSNIVGQQVMLAPISATQTTLNLEGYDQGIYLVQVERDGEPVSTQKLIVR